MRQALVRTRKRCGALHRADREAWEEGMSGSLWARAMDERFLGAFGRHGPGHGTFFDQ